MDQGQLVDLKSVVTKFIQELKKRGINPEKILLYGSYARGEATEESDVDLVVIADDFEKIPPLERLELLSYAAWPVQASIEAVGYTPREIAEGGKDSIFWEVIEQHHKVLYNKAA